MGHRCPVSAERVNGSIEIPLLPSPPKEIQVLLEENNDMSKFIVQNIRAFNSALAMSSIGVKQEHLPKGPPIFKIQGAISHRIGSLLPTEDKNPLFA